MVVPVKETALLVATVREAALKVPVPAVKAPLMVTVVATVVLVVEFNVNEPPVLTVIERAEIFAPLVVVIVIPFGIVTQEVLEGTVTVQVPGFLDHEAGLFQSPPKAVKVQLALVGAPGHCANSVCTLREKNSRKAIFCSMWGEVYAFITF